jgi:hypothetical protein
MIHRNPPRLGEMLGEDDWFEKTTATGRDYERFNCVTCSPSTKPPSSQSEADSAPARALATRCTSLSDTAPRSPSALFRTARLQA